MKKRARTFLTVALAGAALALALGAAAGSQTDPLVTMSYLTDVNTPAILKQVDAKLDGREQALADKLSAVAAQYEKDMDAKLSNAGGGSAGTASSVYAVVTVAAGQQLLGNTGTEFMLRGGAATCVAASAPGLIDSTGGDTLASGGTLQLNHLYLSTADGRGLKATADATVLVRGSYTLG